MNEQALQDDKLQEALELACRAHIEKQELLIAFIVRLATKYPALSPEVRQQFREWNLPGFNL